MYQGKYDKKLRQVSVYPANRSKGPRLGGVIFYTVFFLCIFAFYTATYFGLLELRDWLTRYEMAQPAVKSRAVFVQLFSDPDWGALYDAAGVPDSTYESRDVFVSQMEKTVGENDLSYMETSAGLSGDKKYVVRLGEEKIAAFTLVDHNAADAQTDIPDWQLGTVEFFFERDESYHIEKLDGHSVYVNDVLLSDSVTVKVRTTGAEEYLPEGVTGVRVCTQQISGLAAVPSVRILDGSGNEMVVRYDASSRTFKEEIPSDVIGDEEREAAVNAVKTYALYMITRAGEADIAQYFKRGSDAYRAITDTELGFVQNAVSREFVNETVTDYCRYTEALFSVRVSVTLNQYRADASVKVSTIDQSLFFEKQASGKWLCYAMTAVDVSAPSEQVLITFMDGETVLDSNFHDSGIRTLTCPVVSPPEGKKFSGWMAEGTDERGKAIMKLVFQPDENGIAAIPGGTALEPMTLYPYFEDAADEPSMWG